MNREFEKILLKMSILKSKYFVMGIKSGTEVEDMDFSEIGILHEIAKNQRIPLIVKIGGPEARNDIRQLLTMGVEGILAPMVESTYGLKNFIDSLQQLSSHEQFEKLTKAVNIETITACSALSDMLNSKAGQLINHITVGRGDLSACMNLPVDHDEVIRQSKIIVSKARNNGKTTSVGGNITPLNATLISRLIEPDRINTRHLLISLKNNTIVDECIIQALEFEILLYELLGKQNRDKSLAYKKRVKVTRERINQKARVEDKKISVT
jgi:hypothetical protein